MGGECEDREKANRVEAGTGGREQRGEELRKATLRIGERGACRAKEIGVEEIGGGEKRRRRYEHSGVRPGTRDEETRW